MREECPETKVNCEYKNLGCEAELWTCLKILYSMMQHRTTDVRIKLLPCFHKCCDLIGYGVRHPFCDGE